MALEVGQVYEATLDVKNAAGALANPATAVLTITFPDGTTSAPAVALPPAVTGHVIYDHLGTMAGIHKFAWVTTSPNTAQTDYVTFRNFVSLVSRQEAKDHLNFRPGTDSDEELSRFMQAATELVETKAGYSIRRTFTDYADGPDGILGLLVPRHPVLSVQSVTSLQSAGPSWVTADLRVDDAGIIFQVIPSGFWGGPWNIAYTVGRLVPHEKHTLAAKEQLRHLWDTQRGSMPPSLLSGEETFTTASGFTFAVPPRVFELIENEVIPAI